MIKLWLVVPCYNEEEILQLTADKLRNKMHEMQQAMLITPDSKILFVDDGSKDNTWCIIKDLAEMSDMCRGIKLSHNQGHQNALLAGMMYAKQYCDCMVSLDADLQDDIDVLPEFIERYESGCHIVYGVRKDRSKDSKFKRETAQAFYKVMKMLGVELIYNHADYRLMSNVALEALSRYDETNLFLRGIVPQIGLKSDMVYYDRKERAAGVTKYPLRKMVSFALNGVTSFSVKPLRVISVAGIIFSFLSSIGLMYALISYFFGYTVQGWTAIVCSIWLLGGIQLLGIGVLGEYIGKIFSEVKHRPRYFIEESVGEEICGDH